MAVHVAELANLEVADGDAREAHRLGPLGERGELAQHDDAVQVEVGGEEGVHEEQLAERVDQVEHLDGEVEHRQVVAVFLAADGATVAADGHLEAVEAAVLAAAVVAKVALQLPRHVVHQSLPLSEIIHLTRRSDQPVDRHPRPAPQRLPYDARRVEENSL